MCQNKNDPMHTFEVQIDVQKEKMQNTVSAPRELLGGKFGFWEFGTRKGFYRIDVRDLLHLVREYWGYPPNCTSVR